MARRRPLTGRPLLLASTGLALAVGCGRKNGPPDSPVGNLMAPASVTLEVCVDVLPAEAAGLAMVVVGRTLATERCTTVETSYGDAVGVEVSAPGFLSQTIDVLPEGATAAVSVTLVPGFDVTPEPVGNLMAPVPR